MTSRTEQRNNLFLQILCHEYSRRTHHFRFEFGHEDILIFPREKTAQNLNGDELIQRFADHEYGVNAKQSEYESKRALIAYLAGLYNDPEKRDLWDRRQNEMIQLLSGVETPNFLGGSGITDRSTSETARLIFCSENPAPEEIHQAEQEYIALLTTTTRKIVFLGNGMSPTPLDVIQFFELDDTHRDLPEIVVVDTLNYAELLDELKGLQEYIDEHGFAQQAPPSLATKIRTIEMLLQAEAEGKLTILQHMLTDSDRFPDEYQPLVADAELVINVYGPPESTLQQQLSCLAPDGKLLFAADTLRLGEAPTLPEGYTSRKLGTFSYEILPVSESNIDSVMS
ncbi:hypothetical protein LRY65_04805 [Candidatus Woesebacteria bacterium]|nr:hypothetical protein [Candidatus Woesebacteria bacterium]MCD8506889.1 hypothetical protein [Candidatus Woesebacteria bacterium]MCD8527492.1 hypothetical protein [Candidatus Woesebacteria bacterium]MCD8546233.1 hypothetical protein [Candidatus Woesebacteria bacterium]